jgi:hypothetical protein
MVLKVLCLCSIPYVVMQAEWCGRDGGDRTAVLFYVRSRRARGGGAGVQPQFVAYVRAPARAYPFAAGEWILLVLSVRSMCRT